MMSYSLIISCSWILVNNANKDDVWLDGSARGEDWITLYIPGSTIMITVLHVLCPIPPAIYVLRTMDGGIQSSEDVSNMVVYMPGWSRSLCIVKRQTNQQSLENNDRVCRSADCWDMASRLDLTKLSELSNYSSPILPHRGSRYVSAG